MASGWTGRSSGWCRGRISRSPGYPFLYLQPAAQAVAVSPDIRPWGPSAPRYDSSDGWIGTALESYRLALRRQQRMLSSVRAFLYGAFRGMEPGGEEARAWAQILGRALEKLPWWGLTEAARLDPVWLLGREPKGSGDFRLAASVYLRQTQLATEYGWPSEELRARTRLAFRQTLEKGRSEGASEGYLTSVARDRLEAEFHLGFPQELLQRFRQDGSTLLLEGWTREVKNLIPAVLWAGRARESEEDRLTRFELQELVDRYQSLVAEETRGLAKVSIPDLLAWARRRLERP